MSSEPSSTELTDFTERSRSNALKQSSPLSVSNQFPLWIPPLLYLLLALLFLWRSTLGGQVFLPAGILGSVAPYHGTIPTDAIPPWNPLRWDGIAQFYPWRNFYAQSLQSGIVPLWNPFQFCGTPFVANSQSAVYYPLNLFFVILPTARAFAVNAVLHLTLCGWFTFLMLRRFRLSNPAAFLGGCVFAFSAWQVQWLQLPTFLATSCWIPLVLLGVHRIFSLPEKDETGKVLTQIAALGASLGMMLLAGHLQIAFYGILAGTLFALALTLRRVTQKENACALRGFLSSVAALALGGMLCAPQLLPSLELSQVSHRVGKPSAEGYAAYTEYALPLSGLVTLTLPNFHGNDYDPNNLYWGFYLKRAGELSVPVRHNAAETALYLGIVPLLLVGISIGRKGVIHRLTQINTDLSGQTNAQRPTPNAVFNALAAFFALLALLALLMALGTPIDAIFYFGVPGFGQSGSPGRVLCLWSLAMAVLAAFGLDALLQKPLTKKELAGIGLGLVLILAVGLSGAASSIGAVPAELLRGTGIPALGEVFGRIGEDWIRLLIFGGVGVAVMAFSAKLTLKTGQSKSLAGIVIGLCILDGFVVGVRVNPTANPEWVYPATATTDYLKRETGHERVFPVNQTWSLYRAPDAVLPPNGAMVYGLHDTQGYDSLLTGQYKNFANSLALPNRFGGVDASPHEVGNMVFTQNPNAPNAPLTGAKFMLFSAKSAAGQTATPLLNENETQLFPMPGAKPRAFVETAQSDLPVQWSEDAPTRVTLQTSATVAGVLHLQDGFYPGWHVTVDGTEAVIEPQLNAPFRSVDLSAGTHTVSFFYAPSSSRVGFYLMCVGLSLLCGSFGFIRSIRGKKE